MISDDGVRELLIELGTKEDELRDSLHRKIRVAIPGGDHRDIATINGEMKSIQYCISLLLKKIFNELHTSK
jgi:hypothetical protein